ncbi:hypothetical protein LIER_37935 [Lithospermum erythrorhizon]|uniref:Uncharacterized protein n=1 Tax=Lithospermum erythrorhizon TaxID=34254 RepID=A0AAV3PSZ2_LITER
MLVLPHVPACTYCGAYKFYKETAHFYCFAVQVSITTHVLPEYLVSLLTGQGDDSKDFHTMLRIYKNHFKYSSMSIHCDTQLEQRNHGIYTIRAQGQIHHFLNDLLPANPSAVTSGLHFYFYDPVEQVAARTTTLPRLKPSTVAGLVKVMEPNLYSSFLRMLSSLNQLDRYCITIKSDSTLDQSVYNRRTTTEVVGIWLEDESGATNSYDRDIRVYARSGHNHNIQYYYVCYNPLQYVLMFPAGEPGWHGNIPTVGSVLVESSSVGIPKLPILDSNQPCSLNDLLASEVAGISVQRRDIGKETVLSLEIL